MPSNETPAPAAAFTKRDLMRQTIALVERIIDLDTPANKRAYLVTSLSQYSKSFLVKIGELLQGDPVIAEGVARQLIDSEVEGVINETVHFYRLLDIDDYWEASALIRSLSQYDAFISKPDLSKVSPEAQEQCLALISATRIITSETEIPYGDSNHPIEYIINGDWPGTSSKTRSSWTSYWNARSAQKQSPTSLPSIRSRTPIPLSASCRGSSPRSQKVLSKVQCQSPALLFEHA